MVTLLDPKNDYVFKRLFAGDPELTVALINDLRPELPQVVWVEILNPTIEASELTGKGVVLDLRAQKRATIDRDRIEESGPPRAAAGRAGRLGPIL